MQHKSWSSSSIAAGREFFASRCRRVFFETNFQRVFCALKEELKPILTTHHQEALAVCNYRANLPQDVHSHLQLCCITGERKPRWDLCKNRKFASSHKVLHILPSANLAVKCFALSSRTFRCHTNCCERKRNEETHDEPSIKNVAILIALFVKKRVLCDVKQLKCKWCASGIIRLCRVGRYD